MNWKNSFELRPHIAAEGLGFHSGQDNRNVENPSRLAESYRVVDDRLAVEIRGSEQHLRLMVDECDRAIVGSKQTFLAAFHMLCLCSPRCGFNVGCLNLFGAGASRSLVFL